MTVIDEIAQEISEFETEHGRKPVEMWLTKRDKSDIGKLHRNDKAVTGLFGVPISSWDATEREYRLSGANGQITATKVRAQVADWIERLDALFDQLTEWASAVPNAHVVRDHMPQQVEEMLARFSLKVRAVPTLTVFVDKKYRISFVPSALWIVGANGRINVTTNYRQYALLDLAKTGQPSNWQLLVTGARTNFKTLDHALFLRLLAERS